MHSRFALLLCIGFTLCLTSVPGRRAFAQSGPGLILSPWEDQAVIDVDGSGLYEEGKTDADETNFSLRLYQASGRTRLGTQRGAPVGGFDLTHLDFTSSDPLIPDRLTDQSLGIGMGLGRFGGLEFAATVGVGYATDTPYTDEDAWYPKASLIVSRKMQGNAKILFTLSYDGNRTVFPDIPLPGIAYSDRWGPNLGYTIGFPLSSIRWQPRDRLTLTLHYAIPYSVAARAEYRLTDRWSVFTGYETHNSAFHRAGDPDDRRLFFEQSRIEVGSQWQLPEQVPGNSSLILAIGYAFNQELSRGFDLRDPDTLRDLNEDAYVRVGVKFDF